MAGEPASNPDRVRAAEIIGVLSLATDLGMGLPLEHGLQSTLVAMRLCERLGVDPETTTHTYYGCLLFYVGCTVDANLVAETFPDGALLAHFSPVMFGSSIETMAGIMRAVSGPDTPALLRVLRVATRLPKAVSGHRRHIAALCEVAQMLSERLGVPTAVGDIFAHLTERWDGKSEPGRIKGEEIPLPLRIMHVARDAALQKLIGGEEHAARVIGERAGHAFDPEIANLLSTEAADLLQPVGEEPAWDAVLAIEPAPHMVLEHGAIDRALAAIGDFADLLSPFLLGHSAGVASLAGVAADRCGFSPIEVGVTRRAALVHDLGRVAVSTRIWQKPGGLTIDEREQVRLHPYYTERVLSFSPYLAALLPAASFHHERLDGSGYHRASTAAAIPAAARVVAAADAYHAMTEPRPHRQAFSPSQAAKILAEEARAGRFDPGSVEAVLELAGQPPPRLARPAGLTERESEVVVLLARGYQIKQIARALGISFRTADHHVQHAYSKMGVSTRAAAAVFAMDRGLMAWGEPPIASATETSQSS